MCRPPAVSAYHPAASDGGPVVSHTRHPVGNCAPPRRVPSMCFDTCATAPLLAVSRTHPARDVDRLFSGVRRGAGGDSPARRPGADGRCASPVTLPCTLPRPFWVPRRRSNSDHAGKSTYSGEIESVDRNCDSHPGNAISWELTFLVITLKCVF